MFANWQVMPGTKTPIQSIDIGSGQHAQVYTFNVVDVDSGATGVGVRQKLPGRGWATRIQRDSDLPELQSHRTKWGGWVGSLWSGIKNGVNDFLRGLTAAGKKLWPRVEKVITKATELGQYVSSEGLSIIQDAFKLAKRVGNYVFTGLSKLKDVREAAQAILAYSKSLVNVASVATSMAERVALVIRETARVGSQAGRAILAAFRA